MQILIINKRIEAALRYSETFKTATKEKWINEYSYKLTRDLYCQCFELS